MRNLCTRILLLGIFAVFSEFIYAELRLPAVFSDHVVLQRDRPLPIWGWASPGDKIIISLGKEKGECIADPTGKWMVRLPAQPVCKEPLTLTVKGGSTLEVKDVLLGDVWLCSGQSNMDFGLGGCNVPDDIKCADFPLIRHFRTEYNFASSSQMDVHGRWSVCSPGSAPGFSAVGFYFARQVFKETGVPIGLLTSSVGGTNIELWISQETLLKTQALQPYARLMKESLTEYQNQLAEALPAIEAWTAASRDAQRANAQIPMPPKWPEFPFGEKVARPRCATLHNGMIAPLIPFGLKGVLWYQGENNTDGNLYFEKKSAMIADWRAWFEKPDLPFYFVQLAAWQKPDENPAGGGWGAIRDVQRRCLGIPYTGMAVTIDIGDADDIHPKNKADVGERLALWALKNEYGKAELETSGPLYKAINIEGNRIRIAFEHTSSGLMIGKKIGKRPVEEDKSAKLQRFSICGSDGKWYWADATIDGDSVLVASSEVSKPTAVRYADGMNPAGCNLYNRAGLPASPFRAGE